MWCRFVASESPDFRRRPHRTDGCASLAEPGAGIEPATFRLRGGCSTTELPGPVVFDLLYRIY